MIWKRLYFFLTFSVVVHVLKRIKFLQRSCLTSEPFSVREESLKHPVLLLHGTRSQVETQLKAIASSSVKVGREQAWRVGKALILVFSPFRQTCASTKGEIICTNNRSGVGCPLSTEKSKRNAEPQSDTCSVVTVSKILSNPWDRTVTL